MFGSFRKSSSGITKESSKPQFKPKPENYYPAMFGDQSFDRIAKNLKYKKIIQKSFPITKRDKDVIDLEPLYKKIGENQARSEIAARLLRQIKRHYLVEEFRQQWNKKKISPGSAEHSHVVVYGDMHISDEKDFPFYTITESSILSCKIQEPPAFKNGHIAVLGETKISVEENPRVYLDTAVIFLHRNDFR